jgi:2-methylisocitrate lyase-like PEP mutase family enzyme
MSPAQQLRRRLAAPGMLVAPGAYDAIGARLIEQAGFDAVYMTGAGVSAARGYPDFGLLTQSEMVESATAMAALRPAVPACGLLEAVFERF